MTKPWSFYEQKGANTVTEESEEEEEDIDFDDDFEGYHLS